MTVISTQEFVANQNKYFDMAINQDICIKRDEGMFHIRYNPVEESNEYICFEPDEEFYNSITMDEARKKLHLLINKLYAKK